MSNPAQMTLGELFSRREKVYEQSLYHQGWKDCKREVLKILKQDWTGLDRSINSCDSWYIKKIEEL